jgi:hypothetical protein
MTVQLAVEQDHATHSVEWDSVGCALLRLSRPAEQRRQEQAEEQPQARTA